MKRPSVQMSFAAAFHARISASRGGNAGSELSAPDSGGNSDASSESSARASSWSRMSTARGGSGCPSCGAASGESGMPPCRFECSPVTLEPRTSGPGCSWLPTPTASAYGSNAGGMHPGPARPSLATMARRNLLPTPKASDGKHAGQDNGHGPHRSVAVMAFLGTIPTPTVHGNHNRSGSSPTSGDGLATAMGGTLNPSFLELIMGFPVGWTDVPAKGPSATPSYRKRRARRG